MFDQPIIRVCLVLGSLITATYILRRVRLAKVQIEDTIFWLLFSGILLILAIFPGIAYWAAYLLGFQSPSTLSMLSSSFCCWPNSFLCPSGSVSWTARCAF